MSEFNELDENVYVRDIDIEKIPENITFLGDEKDVDKFMLMLGFNTPNFVKINFFGLLDSAGSELKEYPLIFMDLETAEFIATKLKELKADKDYGEEI